jgi:uncharacterized protein
MAILLLTVALFSSQVYWAVRTYGLIKRFPALVRWIVGPALVALYCAALGYNGDRLFEFPRFGPQPNPVRMGLADASLGAMQWWMLSSLAAFLIAIPVEIFRVAVRTVVRRNRKRRKPPAPPPVLVPGTPSNDRPISPDRRHFLERAAGTVLAFPFLGGAYALLYERLNLEITRKQIRLPNLPKEFHGFRIAQLSDFHISAFMSEEQIRKYAAIANSLRADLIVLTGDFVTWDKSAERSVVTALSGLKAPFGVFGCLGNHEAWSETKDSISYLFQRAGIRILRDSCVRISSAGEKLNLIGVEPDHGWSSHLIPVGLLSQFRVNILLSHYPTLFDHAADLGIELTLAGHTHGGQVKLNFISPQLAPKLFSTPYVAGWFQKESSQLYVNRGIGTIGIPMRAGVPPEIAVFELVS